MNYKGLPIFKATIGDADGMVVCSFVEDAAVEANFLAFAEDKKPIQFSIENEDKHIVIGVVMRANFPIYRYSEDLGEFYIVYTPEVIREMVQKFFRNGYQNNVDLDHSFKLEDGVYIEQAFIKDTENGISPKNFEDIEDGSLFFQYKVENEEIWAAIKEGTYAGFSLAGTFGIEETFNKQEQNNNEITNKFMGKLNRIKQVLRSLLVEFGEISTDGGVLIWDTDEELKIGDAVHSVDENGNDVPVEDGTYTTEDKKQIIVKDGKVDDIVDVDAEVSSDEPVEEPQENADDDPAIEPAEEPATDDKDELIKQLQERIAELEAENEELKAKLEEQPAAPSAEEAFEALENAPKKETEADKLRKRGYKF